MHYDQRWLDLVPALFDDVHIVRDAGCNVAYWNLPERGLTLTQNGMQAHDSLCRFFHFSGFEPERPEIVTRYSRRLTMDDHRACGRAVRALSSTSSALRVTSTCKDWPYSFGAFDNGVPIPDVARRLYQEMSAAADRFR